jgi:hypothetical protein
MVSSQAVSMNYAVNAVLLVRYPALVIGSLELQTRVTTRTERNRMKRFKGGRMEN